MTAGKISGKILPYRKGFKDNYLETIGEREKGLYIGNNFGETEKNKKQEKKGSLKPKNI